MLLTGLILRIDCSGRACATTFCLLVAPVSLNTYHQISGDNSNLNFMLKNVCKKLCTIMLWILTVLHVHASDFSNFCFYQHHAAVMVTAHLNIRHCPDSVLCDPNKVDNMQYSKHTEHSWQVYFGSHCNYMSATVDFNKNHRFQHYQ
jgi:hypothetical protein